MGNLPDDDGEEGWTLDLFEELTRLNVPASIRDLNHPAFKI